MRFPILLVLVLLLPAACAARKDSAVDLTLACQLNKCVCAAPKRLFLESEAPQAVLWKENGDAYCPEGFKLKLAKD